MNYSQTAEMSNAGRWFHALFPGRNVFALSRAPGMTVSVVVVTWNGLSSAARLYRSTPSADGST